MRGAKAEAEREAEEERHERVYHAPQIKSARLSCRSATRFYA